MNVERHCQFCGARITDCNGFVNAGEFARLLNGEKIVPREFCGRCDVRMMLEEDRRNEVIYQHAELPFQDG